MYEVLYIHYSLFHTFDIFHLSTRHIYLLSPTYRFDQDKYWSSKPFLLNFILSCFSLAWRKKDYFFASALLLSTHSLYFPFMCTAEFHVRNKTIGSIFLQVYMSIYIHSFKKKELFFLSSEYSPRSGRPRHCTRSPDAVCPVVFCPAVRNTLRYAMWIQSTSYLPDIRVSFYIVVKFEIIDVI